MNFVTLAFAFFFLFVLLMHSIFAKGKITYRVFLLAFNLLFYGFAGLEFVPLLVFVGSANWLCAKLLYNEKQSRKKIILGINISIQVLLLVFYKYYEFFLINLEAGLNYLGFYLPIFELIAETKFLLPIGLSFYIFQGLSYCIDQYRNPHERPENFLNVLIFVSFFPTILAGPILRAKPFFEQLQGKTIANPVEIQEKFLPNGFANLAVERQDILLGFSFILSGLFKKVVLASYLSEQVVRDSFSTPEFYSSPALIIAVYAYAMQIYCDFSGYSDLAVGIARLLGYRLPQNFNAPYLACSLQDFWRRWHISLSTWLRDYLYIPLGGNQRGSKSLNLLLTMTIGGLWHGAHLRYFIWGFFHGLGLCFVYFWQLLRKPFAKRIVQAKKKEYILMLMGGKYLSRLCAWFLTFHFVCLLWIFFRADNAEKAFEIIRFIIHGNLEGDGFVFLAIPAILCTMFTQFAGAYIFRNFVGVMQKLILPLQVLIIALLCAFILKLGPAGVLPFIYFQF